ncbi:hypothetical protein FLAG1_06972 [Fusarium langsethiae]|uniref:2EXR domain-containing protein n=1 Tax=Fusarium langsethiae TaxID=179993 RepID=A0A0N0V6B5_FUSLA|nr:hypothetical protein FLAG1_06972 [Fusarium langsethiae]
MACPDTSPADQRYLQIFNPAPQTCTDFHQFARFPPEIRRLIWEQALRATQTQTRAGMTVASAVNELSANYFGPRMRRRTALGFCRVQLPCLSYSEDKETKKKTTLYICPELDTFEMESLEDFELFAHDVWTRDRLHVGLVNIATCEVDDGFHWVWGRDNALAKQTLLRIEHFTLLNRYWKLEWRFIRRVDITPLLSNLVYRACPVFDDTIDFERLLYDPRLCKEHLKQTYRGPMDLRNEFHAWFTVLELLGIKHDHKVDYRYGMCHGEGEYSEGRFEQNRDAAAEWIRKDE